MGVTLNKHILVVDDDRPILAAVVEALRLEGYSVAAATNGCEALKEVARRAPDVIITDLRMPVMDGWEFVRIYRALPGPHASIICMTADVDAVSRCREINADGCLPKPYDLDDLLACVGTPGHAHDLVAA